MQRSDLPCDIAGFSAPAALCRSVRGGPAVSDAGQRDFARLQEDFFDDGTLYGVPTFFLQRHFSKEDLQWPIRRTNPTAASLSGSSLSSCWHSAGTGTAARKPTPAAPSKPRRQPRLQLRLRRPRLRLLPAQPRRNPPRLRQLRLRPQPPRLLPLRPLRRLQPRALLRQPAAPRPLRRRTDLFPARFCVTADLRRGRSLPPETLNFVRSDWSSQRPFGMRLAPSGPVFSGLCLPVLTRRAIAPGQGAGYVFPIFAEFALTAARGRGQGLRTASPKE
ncbi:hypothetical protein JCM7686_2691 [Paracoccus aminophilus JCM 7686]|uniref:Uncharacterized protein n=1 Tax=Paracoccus aminophilus JCM 7686 TaxID=1367847 RepID=S5XWR6_PARAH|nr:hypothetical protein JCM7686_2691 [Paracoccus aminophilus JCM 7686]